MFVTVGTAILLLEVGAGFISGLTLCLYLFLPSNKTLRRKAKTIYISYSAFNSLGNTQFHHREVTGCCALA